MKKVKVILITKESVEPDCMASVLKQNYPDFSVVISIVKPKVESKNSVLYNYNIMENREEARKMALGSDADYFLFLDSDIGLPLDAISNFVKQLETVPMAMPEAYVKSLGATQDMSKKQCIAGWIPVPTKDDAKPACYVIGKFVDDNAMHSFKEVVPSVTEVDVIGMGCVMVSREVLEKINFEDSLEKDARLVKSQVADFLVDECFTFSDQVQLAGYKIYADGDVVCKHLTTRF